MDMSGHHVQLQVGFHQTLNLLRQYLMTDCYLPLSFICLMLVKFIEVLLVGVRMSLVLISIIMIDWRFEE